MQYIKFTYVDATTCVSVAAAEALNGPAFPAVAGLAFVWARESAYPTQVPEFFGTCPDDSATQIDGVLGVFVQTDFETMLADEMRARNPVPQTVTMRQARLALLQSGHYTTVVDYITNMTGDAGIAARVTWEYSTTVERYMPLTIQLKGILGLTDLETDELYLLATTL
jgi:hypothetical protein